VGYKIVRDNHRKLLEGVISGTWRTSPNPIGALVRKLGEEYSELCENRDPGELYDIQDVLDELMVLLDPDCEHADRHAVKVNRLGLFGDHLEWHPFSEGKDIYK